MKFRFIMTPAEMAAQAPEGEDVDNFAFARGFQMMQGGYICPKALRKVSAKALEMEERRLTEALSILNVRAQRQGLHTETVERIKVLQPELGMLMAHAGDALALVEKEIATRQAAGRSKSVHPVQAGTDLLYRNMLWGGPGDGVDGLTTRHGIEVKARHDRRWNSYIMLVPGTADAHRLVLYGTIEEVRNAVDLLNSGYTPDFSNTISC